MLFAILLISHFVTGVKCLLHQESLPSPTQSPDFMHQLLLQEQQLRIELQKQITGIQSQIQDLRHDVAKCENDNRNLQSKYAELSTNLSSSVHGHQQVAFFVRVRNKITNHHTSTIMVFDDVQLNTGSAYDPHIGTFTSPLEGVYKFDLVLSSAVENGHGDMMHNGVRVLYVYADITNQRYFGRGSGTIIVHMAKGDKVWIQHTDTGNTVINGEMIYTAFSGHLLFTV
ncbi:cerebellin-1-like [Crassostrea virginica]